jgi:beta-N-acetylhexosaminidase
VTAVCRGLTKAGVAPSAKHFPGHGDTHVDSHLSLPIIHKDASALARIDLVPFRKASDAHVATIMIGHMALPAVTGDNTPASLSRAIISDMLRGSLEYDGVAVTDCLEMRAVSAREGGVPQAAVQALQAGADIAMICHRFDRQRDAVEAAYSALRSGTLDRRQILASGRRIAALKDAFAGNWDQVLGTMFDEAGWARLKVENAMLSRQAYASGIALVRNPDDVIPLPKPKTSESRGRGIIIVLTPRMGLLNPVIASGASAGAAAPSGRREMRIAAAGPTYLSFAAGISKRVNGASLHDVYSSEEPLSAEVGDAIDRGLASAVLFVTRNADRAAWQLDRLREVLRRVGKKGSRRLDKVVVLSSYEPYDLLRFALDPLVGEEGMGLDEVGYVACFEPTPEALDAAAAVIFGEEGARGKVPVCGGNVCPGNDSSE